jgi:hypothetical protein
MASPAAAFCSTCGSSLTLGAVLPPAPPMGIPPGMPIIMQTRTSGMAIAGFVLSLVFCGGLGLIFSIIGHNECKRSNGMVTGGGLALPHHHLVIRIVSRSATLFRVGCEPPQPHSSGW